MVQPFFDIASKYQQFFLGVLAVIVVLLVYRIMRLFFSKATPKNVVDYVQNYISIPEREFSVRKRIYSIDTMLMEYRGKPQLQELLRLYSQLSNIVLIGRRQNQGVYGLTVCDRDIFLKVAEYQEAVGKMLIIVLSAWWNKDALAQMFNEKIETTDLDVVLSEICN